MRVIVVGASGLIGGRLCLDARRAGHDVLGTYATRPHEGLVQFDLTKDRLSDLVPDLGPGDAVFLMSAQIDQTWVSDHPEEARRVNVDGTIACADAVMARGCHLIFMSTEAVFGAGCEEGADETAEPAPVSLYAQHKVEVENHLRARPGRWCVARTGSTVGGKEDFRCTISKTYRTLLRPGARMAFDNLFTVTGVTDVTAGLLAIMKKKYNGFMNLAANPRFSRRELADLIMTSSRFTARMSYEAVPFSTIRIQGSRAAQAWLRNGLALRELGRTFTDPRLIVRRKVALLDQEPGPDLG